MNKSLRAGFILIPAKGETMAGESQNTIPWMQAKLLTVPEVANWAKVSTKTVYRWIAEEKIEAIRFGSRTYRIPEQSVAKMLTEQGYEYLTNAD